MRDFLRNVLTFSSGRRSKWLVLIVWLVILGVAGPLSGKLADVQQNDFEQWLPGEAESTKVLKLQEQFRDSDLLPAVVVYERSSGITEADKAAAEADVARFKGVKYVVDGVTGPELSADGKALQTVVPMSLGGESDNWEKIIDPVKELREEAADGPAGLKSHVAGPAGTSADSADAFSGIDSTLLFATLGVVVLLLLLIYRSPTLWILPLISVAAALTAAQGVIYLLAKHADLVVNAQSAGILTVLVLGAGTDYALLLVARYREELRRHEDRHEAMAFALRRAAPAIVASAATVVAGMLCLSFADLNSTQGLGPVAAIGVAVGLLAMVTLLPALLVTVGRWVFWPVRPKFGSREPSARGIWAKAGHAIARAPRPVWVVTTLVLAVAAMGLLGMKSGILENSESFVDKPDSVHGEAIIERHFSAGIGDPVLVIGNADAGARLRDSLSGVRGITGVTEPVVKDGYAYLEATTTSAPDSTAAEHAVERARDAVHAVEGADAHVGGTTAVRLDIENATVHDRDLIIPLVLLVVFVILMILLRALVAPVILIATVVLSFAATMGVGVLVFEHLFDFARVESSIPLFAFVFLVALGIDYNIFLMSRVKEEVQHNHGPRRGALAALTATGSVITSAGLVLAGTFIALGTLPFVFLAQLGFLVAFGVLLDTIVVRAVLVTALNLDLGHWMWWPGKLAKHHEDDDLSVDEMVQQNEAEQESVVEANSESGSAAEVTASAESDTATESDTAPTAASEQAKPPGKPAGD